MQFIDRKHEDSYKNAVISYNIDTRDEEETSLIYLLTASEDCRVNLDDHLFNWETPTALSWNTYKEDYDFDNDEAKKYLPINILCGLDKDLFEACLYSIRIRMRRF